MKDIRTRLSFSQKDTGVDHMMATIPLKPL